MRASLRNSKETVPGRQLAVIASLVDDIASVSRRCGCLDLKFGFFERKGGICTPIAVSVARAATEAYPVQYVFSIARCPKSRAC